MNFNEYIINYKRTCKNKQLAQSNKNDQLELKKKELEKELQNLYKKRPISGEIAHFIGLLSLILTFLTNFAGLPGWLFFTIPTIISMITGYLMDYNKTIYDKNTQKTYNKLETVKKELFEADKELRRLNRLLSDIKTCCEYYAYVVNEKDKDKLIPLDIDALTDDYCRLSTYLDKLYNANLQDFIIRSPYERVIADQRSNVEQKIYEAKKSKNNFSSDVVNYSFSVEEEIKKHRK